MIIPQLLQLAATASIAGNSLADQAASPGIRLCTVGYLPEVAKVATVVGAGASKFAVVDANTGKVVIHGALGPVVASPQTGESAQRADFSSLRKSGTYLVRVEGLADSPKFDVSPRALNRSLECVMLGFYGQRCGQAVRFTWNGQTYAHAKCHAADGLLDYNDPALAGKSREGSGGWHDAGDYGKYTVNAAFATGLALSAWERRSASLRKLQVKAIPEHGGRLPDYLAEMKFNLDWLYKMQGPNGQVAHKLTTLNFDAMEMPEADLAKRFYSVDSRLATLDYAAIGCMAARVFRPFDATYAARWESAAKRAFVAARTMSDRSPSLAPFRTGGYMTSTASDYKWALIEARLAFGEAFLTDEERGKFKSVTESTERMFASVWDWGSGYNLGLLSWLYSKEAKKDPKAYGALERDLFRAADEIVANTHSHVYGRGLTHYAWGVNGSLARTVLVLGAANDVRPDRKYLDAAYDQIAYLYGRNPYGRSFVTGDGFNPPMKIHHRPSAADGIDAPWPGHLVGGPHPKETDWKDLQSDFRTNEIAINWDAALVFALATFYRP